MNQHYNPDDGDYGELAANVKLIAIDEMRHAEMFAERIKELGGEPTTEMADKVTRGQEVEAMFPMDAGLEDTTMDEYNRFARICHDNGDSETMKLFETIIGEQIHFNYFDNGRALKSWAHVRRGSPGPRRTGSAPRKALSPAAGTPESVFSPAAAAFSPGPAAANPPTAAGTETCRS